MLPSVGYFKSINCPYYENDSCDRPFCQFRHDASKKSQINGKQRVKDSSEDVISGPSNSDPAKSEDSKTLAIEQIVSEAVKKLFKENEQLFGIDPSKILELVGQQNIVQQVIDNLTPVQRISDKNVDNNLNNSKSKSHKLYSIPAGTPAYTPTPLSVLKKKKVAPGTKEENYVPILSSVKKDISYKPSLVTKKIEDSYIPSSSTSIPVIDYTPSSRGCSNSVSDHYTPQCNADYSYDYKPTNKDLSSSEPSYSPSTESDTTPCVNYSPSTITTLTEEPTYSPASNSTLPVPDYTPSICTNEEETYIPLSPEKYLAMLENDGETKVKEVISKKEDEEKRSRSSKHKHKDKERSKDREKEKEKHRDKDKGRDKKDRNRRRDKEKSDESKSKRKDKESSHSKDLKQKTQSSEDRKCSTFKGDASLKATSATVSKEYDLAEDGDYDRYEEESDIDEECYRIFQEYKPTEINGNEEKKRKSTEDVASTEPVIPVKKQRIAHTGSTELRPVKNKITKPPPKLSPSMVMLERFRKLQSTSITSLPSTSTHQPISSSTSLPSTTSLFSSVASSSEKRRIAHVPNVHGLLSTKPKLVPSSSSITPTTTSKPILASKSNSNVVATSRVATLPRPMIGVEYGSRVPANVRQRYLNIFVDEMLKIYDREEDAYERAVTEEKQCYTRSSNKTVYLNVVVNTVNRLRKEAESGGIKPAVNQAETTNSTERKIISHSAVLAGKGGATVSWSIEKPRLKVDSSILTGSSLYKLLERYVLTSEQQNFNGYPRPDPAEKGKAVVNTSNKFRSKPNVNLNADQRLCDRCGTVYRVNMKGLAVKTDEMCTYHWGRPFQRRGETRYSCCQGESNSEGCSVGKYHVSDMANPENLRGFVQTLVKSPQPDGSYGVFALDCEMCYTTEGPELTRITVVGTDCQTVYETLVKPDNPILDYNTRFSGITEDDLQNVKTTIRDVQAVLLSKFSDKTILIGHSFDSDLRALKLIHNTVVDTSIVFPHPRGPPYKKALRTLCVEMLQKIIQNDVSGHDSAEDAIACMELMLWKLKQDLKLLK